MMIFKKCAIFRGNLIRKISPLTISVKDSIHV